jgi:2-(1,2-epoxy-1,2-dihydrophenyl)acetyl-CoA isomerase
MMLGDAVSAIEAERMGMIYQYFADDTFVEKSKAIAIKLAKMPTRALFYTKKALNWSALHTLDEQLMNEDKLQQRAASTSDFKEGVQAFVEKRNPNFKGE